MRHHRRRSTTAGIAAVVLTLACRPGAGNRADSEAAPRTDSAAQAASDELPRADSVSVQTDRTRYRPGEPMTLTVTNASAQQYAFNPCQRTIERRANDTWMTHTEPDRVCTMEAWILEPHGTRTAQTELPSELPGATYRVRIRLTVEGNEVPANAVVAVSDPIVVS